MSYDTFRHPLLIQIIITIGSKKNRNTHTPMAYLSSLQFAIIFVIGTLVFFLSVCKYMTDGLMFKGRKQWSTLRKY